MAAMKLTWNRLPLKLRHRFATSRDGVDEKETIVVRLEHEGVAGEGEITPSTLYGQSLESSEAALAEIATWIGGHNPFRIHPIIDELIRRHDGQRATIAAIDSALYDWVGRRVGRPTWELLGLNPPRCRTTFTIGVADAATIRVKTREALQAGAKALKVKVGTPADRETLEIIRSEFDGPLLMDANEAWTPADAADQIRGLAKYRPAMIEQPLRREFVRHNAELRKLGVAPIFVDEDCERPADVVRLHGLVDGVNVKFNKCGGIREALRMFTLARGLGMGVMLGCFVCSSLAIAPALAIAELTDYADLDGALLLAQDPYEGITFNDGLLEFGNLPGVGVRYVGRK